MYNYKKMIGLAKKQMQNSYSPYSRFKVGACVLTKNNKYYTGANIENATYGATICAERLAISKAVLDGEKEIVCLLIVSSSNDYTYPCGICRQTLKEFSSNAEVVVAKNENDYKIFTIDELLPNGFEKNDIK